MRVLWGALTALLLGAGATKAPPTIEVSAFVLASDYEENEVAADAKYKGKVLDVKGYSRGVERLMGAVYVTLFAGEGRDVSAELAKAEGTKTVVGVRFRDIIIVRCRCDGLGVIGVTVLLSNCRFRSVEHASDG